MPVRISTLTTALAVYLFLCALGEASMTQGMSKWEIARTLKSLEDPHMMHKYLQSDAFVLDTKDDSVRRITDSPAKENYPALSDDGKTLLFCRGGLYVLDVETMTYTRIASDDMDCKESRWIPNSTKLSFLGQPDTEAVNAPHPWLNDIFVVGRDGAGRKNLTNSPEIEEYGHDWSPDGNRIAYIQRPFGTKKSEICIQVAMGFSYNRKIVDAPQGASQVVWGGNGEKLYCAYKKGKAGLQNALH